jgi:hypothetical protein
LRVDTVVAFVAELFDEVFEVAVTARPLLFVQCGSFTPAFFPQRGQMPEAEVELAE